MIRPISKTLVAEAKITVADVNTRTMLQKLAAAAKIGSNPLTQLDRIVSDTEILEINGIQTVLILSSFAPIVLEQVGATETLVQKVNNLYILSGSIPNTVRIRSETSVPVRVSVIYS